MKAAARRFAASVEGLSPEAIALLLTTGLVLGTFPIYGIPTALCALASFALGINFPALQIVNQLLSPLQLALILPLARLGVRIVGPAAATASPFWKFGAVAQQAVAAWVCFVLPLGLVVYVALACVLRRSGTSDASTLPSA